MSLSDLVRLQMLLGLVPPGLFILIMTILGPDAAYWDAYSARLLLGQAAGIDPFAGHVMLAVTALVLVLGSRAWGRRIRALVNPASHPAFAQYRRRYPGRVDTSQTLLNRLEREFSGPRFELEGAVITAHHIVLRPWGGLHIESLDAVRRVLLLTDSQGDLVQGPRIALEFRHGALRLGLPHGSYGSVLEALAQRCGQAGPPVPVPVEAVRWAARRAPPWRRALRLPYPSRR